MLLLNDKIVANSGSGPGAWGSHYAESDITAVSNLSFAEEAGMEYHIVQKHYHELHPVNKYDGCS